HHRPCTRTPASLAGDRPRHARREHEPGHRAPAGGTGDGAGAAPRSRPVFAGAFRMSQPAFDFDLVVLGGGSGGLAGAFRAAGHGARVALLEPGALGGTCVNVGCVPKKAMWLAAGLAQDMLLARELGFAVPTPPPALDWPAFIAFRQKYIANIHASYLRRLDAAGIALLPVRGRLAAPGVVACDNGLELHAREVLVATGGRPQRPAVDGAGLAINSDGFFALDAAPRRVAVVGAGYIAVELAGV